MIVEDLKNSILNFAFTGKLTNHNYDDDSIFELIDEIKKNNHQSKIKPISDSDELFDIPKNWIWVRLGSLCSLITKGSSPKWQGIQYVNDGVLFVTSENVGKGELIWDNKKYVEKEFNNISPRSILKKGDLLTNIVGASIGRTAEYDLEDGANINQAVCIIRLYDDRFKKYILKYMNSKIAYKIMMNDKVETARPNISLTNINDFMIPLPPIEEQQRIVSKIEQLFDKLAELEPIEKELYLLKKDFSKKFKKSILQDYMHINSNNTEIGYEQISMKNLVSISTGKKDANYGSENGQYYFFTCSKNPIRCSNYSFEGESILLAGNGNIGNINYYNGKFEAYQRTYVLQKNSDKIYLKYLYYHLLADWEEYNNYQIFGTAIPYIKLGNVQNYIVNCPSLEEQKRIVEKIEQVLPLLDDIDNLVNE